MKTKHPTLAVDIGNTNTHAGLIDVHTLHCLKIEVFPTKEITQKLLLSLSSLCEGYEKARVPVVVSSVNRSLRQVILTNIDNCGFLSATWMKWHSELPISVVYKNPEKLGTDRIANALYSHAVHPGQNKIIICSGTATTIDFLKKGDTFLGGTILPGILTQFKSLKDNTNELPFVNSLDTALTFPGTDTEECIHAGVILGTCGAITHIVDKYKSLFGNDCIVLAGGGAWKYLRQNVDFEHTYVENLTLIGTALYSAQ